MSSRSSRRDDTASNEDEEEKRESGSEEEQTKEEDEEEDEKVDEEEGEEEKSSEPKEEEPPKEEYQPVAATVAVADEDIDPETAAQMDIIKNTDPTTDLEIALKETLKKRDEHIERLNIEVTKLKEFISKRKQTYKRKRKETGAPTRALSAYNIFVQDRFSKLAKENEQALKSSDSDAKLKRVPPASLVASTGNAWKALSAEEKAHYEERAREDRKRYEEQMAKYQPPDKQSNRKRNKTGYNMFFSAHVLRLKQTDAGVPSERGSVARLVGNAWKALGPEEKQYYEREADKQNGMNPIEKDEDEDDEDKRGAPEYMHQMQPDMQQYGMHPGMAPGMPAQHDPRQHGYAAYPTHHMAYGQAPYQGQHYEAQGHAQARYHQGRAHQGYQGYPQRHPYDNSGMGM